MMRSSLLLVVCACGDGIAIPDAVVPDADDGRGVVEVQLVNHDRFRSTAVYFQERDSTLALATRLDENGFARGYLHAHGFVTVIDDIGGGITPVYTYSNVSPGDQLVIDPNGARPFKGGAQVRLRIPSVPDAEFYTLETPCNITDASMATVQSILIDLSGCGTLTDLLVLAHASLGELYLFENDVMLSEAAPVTVSLANRQYQPLDESTVTITNLPAPATRWFIEKGIALGKNVLHNVSESIDVADRSASLTSVAPGLPAITAFTSTSPDSLEPETARFENVIDWRPWSPQITIDLAEHDLREQTAPARYVPGESKIGWSEASTGLLPQITVARMQWSTPETLVQWTILGKRDEGSEARLDLPVLPNGLLVPDPRSPPYDLYRIAVAKDATRAIDKLLGWTPGRWPIEGESGTVVWQVLSQQ